MKIRYIILSISCLFLIIFGLQNTTKVKAVSFVHTFKKTTFVEKGDANKDFSYNFTRINQRHLKAKTDWFTDNIGKGPNDVFYYRIATNEWVSTDDVALVHTDINQSFTISIPHNIWKMNPKTYEFTYSGRRLAAGTWSSSESVQLPRSVPYCKVGPNEWVHLIHY